MLSEELRQTMIDTFKEIPDPREVIEWAKANNFKFVKRTLGREKSCGCVVTAMFIKQCGEKDYLVDEAYIEDGVGFYKQLRLTLLYELSPFKLSLIYLGFDKLNFQISDGNVWGKFGRKVAELVTEEGLWA